MNKLTKLLSVFVIAGALGAGVAGVAACKKNDDSGHTHAYSWVKDNAEQCHEHCDNSGCDTPDKAPQDHVWGDDAVCDNCGYEMEVAGVVISGETTVRNKEQITLTAAVSPDAVEQGVTWSITEGGSYATIDASTGVLTGTGVGTVTVKATSTKDATKFGTYTVTVTVEAHNHQFDGDYEYDTTNHWKACSFAGCEERSGEAAHDGLANDGTGTCTTCGAVIKHSVYEMIPTEILKKEAEFKTTTYNDGLKSGIFTILPGTTVRTRDRLNYDVFDYNNGEGVAEEGGKVETGTFSAKASIQYNGQARGFSVNAVAPGKLTFYCDNGSGSKTKLDKQTILLTKPDGSTQVISYFCGSIYAITINCDQVGEYKITRGNEPGVGTTDVYYVKYEANVLVTPITDIEIVDKGKIDYFVGNEFDKSKLQLQLVHEGGLIDSVDLEDENLTIDSSAFDGTTAGKYTINISYSAEGKQFTAQYEVSVRLVTAIELGFNSIIQGANTSVGNQQFINHTVKQLYFKGDELDLDGLTVKVVMQDGDKQLKDIVKEGFTYSGYNNTQAGKQTITFTWDSDPTVTASFDIFVFDGTAADVTADEIINIKVDGTIADAEVGTLDSGAYQFKTIQQSLDFLEALKLDENVKKVVTLAAGTYKEKLEINIPNLTIKGAENKTDAANYLIEWDSLYGENDEGDFPHTTDSTQTVSVREGAVGLVLEGVTISNWYNSTEHFAEKGIGESGEHRALAILIQADKVVIDNCRLLGYQDTIELFTGRQFIKNTYICGRTDFIFGTNNTTYFYKCEIESIVSGGYVTAFKGLNKADSSGNATDDVLYGAIFDDCDFTAPQAVTTAADTAIGRTWGKYAAVAVVNSRIGGHITKNAYGGKPARYVAMSGAEPTDATVKFLEGNNTGDGALNSEVSGMHLIGANDLPNYSDLSKIFAKVNGKVTYSTDWNGSKGVTVTEKTYAFTADTTGKIESKEAAANGDPLFGGAITVFTPAGKKYWTEIGTGKNFLWAQVGTTLKFDVVGTVFISMYSGYGDQDNLDINYINGKATVTIVPSATQDFSSKNCCITLIKVDTSETPAHVHKYGEWTATKDGGAETYTATRTCLACELETADTQSVSLPALSEQDYEIKASNNAGKFIYTYTHATYGKISFEADAIAGMHQHDYGAWVYDAGSGKITATCNAQAGECGAPTLQVEVPALTDSRYVITDNTADLVNAGTGTYTIVLDGETYSFTAATPKVELTQITEKGTYYTHSTDKATSNEYVYIGKPDCYDNGSYLCFKTGYLVLNVAAGATIDISGGYYGSGWGLYTAYEDYDFTTGTGTELEDTLANKGSKFKTDKGGLIVIKVDETGQSSLTTIAVSFGVTITEENLQEITSAGLTYNYAGDPSSTENVLITGGVEHSGYLYIKEGATVKLKVKTGYKITVVSEYDSGATFVGANSDDITYTTSGDTVTTEYTATQDGIITIMEKSGQLYLKSITVTAE